MKMMKSMIESMMPIMMKGVTSDEKEEMMLKMMPMMMEDIDLAELIPKLMSTMLPLLIHQFLDLINDDDTGENLLDTIAIVIPNICEVIDKKVLAEKKDCMIVNLMKREEFKERMPKCFMEGFPLIIKGCFEHFIGSLSKQDRQIFITTTIKLLMNHCTEDLSSEEMKTLLLDNLELVS